MTTEDKRRHGHATRISISLLESMSHPEQHVAFMIERSLKMLSAEKGVKLQDGAIRIELSRDLGVETYTDDEGAIAQVGPSLVLLVEATR